MRANLMLRESMAGAAAGSSVSVPASAPRTPEAAARPAAPRRGLLERLDDWFWHQREREIAAYLGKSQNVFELEQRMRDLERGTPHPYY